MEPPSLVAVGFEPTTENVAGHYRLQSLVTIIGGVWTDWRAAGATFTIALAPNGTTSGHLFIPGSNDGGGDSSADMAGAGAPGRRAGYLDPAGRAFRLRHAVHRHREPL